MRHLWVGLALIAWSVPVQAELLRSYAIKGDDHLSKFVIASTNPHAVICVVRPEVSGTCRGLDIATIQSMLEAGAKAASKTPTQPEIVGAAMLRMKDFDYFVMVWSSDMRGKDMSEEAITTYLEGVQKGVPEAYPSVRITDNPHRTRVRGFEATKSEFEIGADGAAQISMIELIGEDRCYEILVGYPSERATEVRKDIDAMLDSMVYKPGELGSYGKANTLHTDTIVGETASIVTLLIAFGLGGQRANRRRNTKTPPSP